MGPNFLHTLNIIDGSHLGKVSSTEFLDDFFVPTNQVLMTTFRRTPWSCLLIFLQSRFKRQFEEEIITFILTKTHRPSDISFAQFLDHHQYSEGNTGKRGGTVMNYRVEESF